MAIKTFSTLTLFAFALTATSARADFFDCKPTNVVERENRIRVECSNHITLSGQTVRFLAIAKTDGEQAARFVSLAIAALLSGKTFHTEVPTSGNNNVPGCPVNDCRTPTEFGVKN